MRKRIISMFFSLLIISSMFSPTILAQGDTIKHVIGNDGVAYATVADAITGAGDATEVNITLAGDITEELKINVSSKTITIDLAGNTFAGDITINRSNVMIKDTAPNGISGVVNAVVSLYGDSLEIYGGTFNRDIANYGNLSTPINIYGGTFNGLVCAYTGNTNDGTTINIHGGTFHNDIFTCNDSVINIYDGYFICTDENFSLTVANQYNNNGVINIHGGFFENVYFGYLEYDELEYDEQKK